MVAHSCFIFRNSVIMKYSNIIFVFRLSKYPFICTLWQNTPWNVHANQAFWVELSWKHLCYYAKCCYCSEINIFINKVDNGWKVKATVISHIAFREQLSSKYNYLEWMWASVVPCSLSRSKATAVTPHLNGAGCITTLKSSSRQSAVIPRSNKGIVVFFTDGEHIHWVGYDVFCGDWELSPPWLFSVWSSGFKWAGRSRPDITCLFNNIPICCLMWATGPMLLLQPVHQMKTAAREGYGNICV